MWRAERRKGRWSKRAFASSSERWERGKRRSFLGNPCAALDESGCMIKAKLVEGQAHVQLRGRRFRRLGYTSRRSPAALYWPELLASATGMVVSTRNAAGSSKCLSCLPVLVVFFFTRVKLLFADGTVSLCMPVCPCQP